MNASRFQIRPTPDGDESSLREKASSPNTGKHRTGFTLVEMLVSIVILVFLMAIIFQIIQMTSQTYKQTSQGTGVMQQARVAFERLTRNLSQATLRTYYGYYYAATGGSGSGVAPTAYMRTSELQFISGYGLANAATTPLVPTTTGVKQVTDAVFFQAPLGVVSSTTSYGYLGNLLNACGYFVLYGTDQMRPSFLSNMSATANQSNEYRYRLMEYLKPADYFNLYTTGAIATNGTSLSNWIGKGLPSSLTGALPSPVTVRPLASNIVALIIMPEQFKSGTTSDGEANTAPVYSSSTSTYNYDSAYSTAPSGTPPTQNIWANQMPPLVKVVMIAIDEASAIKLAAQYPSASWTSPPDLGQLSTSSPKLFQDPTLLLTDLQTFEAGLAAKKLNYFVFQTDVVIRGAHWTH